MTAAEERHPRTPETYLMQCKDMDCNLPNPHEGMCDPKFAIEIDYVNWKGNRRTRKISPVGRDSFIFDSNEWHPLPQWMVVAIDHEDGKTKAFAMIGIRSWREVRK